MRLQGSEAGDGDDDGPGRFVGGMLEAMERREGVSREELGRTGGRSGRPGG